MISLLFVVSSFKPCCSIYHAFAPSPRPPSPCSTQYNNMLLHGVAPVSNQYQSHYQSPHPHSLLQIRTGDYRNAGTAKALSPFPYSLSYSSLPPRVPRLLNKFEQFFLRLAFTHAPVRLAVTINSQIKSTSAPAMNAK